MNCCIVSCGQVIQFDETEEPRFIGPEDDSGGAADKWLEQFRYRGMIEPGRHQGQANTEAVEAWNESVGVAARGGFDEGIVCKVIRAFWDVPGQITSDAPWAKVLDVESAAAQRGLTKLHPGATRHYVEACVLN